jgi:hypothetical protein
MLKLKAKNTNFMEVGMAGYLFASAWLGWPGSVASYSFE